MELVGQEMALICDFVRGVKRITLAYSYTKFCEQSLLFKVLQKLWQDFA